MQTSIQSRGRAVVFTRRQARRSYAAVRQSRAARARVATAFRVMAHAVGERTSWVETISFWRRGAGDWASWLD